MSVVVLMTEDVLKWYTSWLETYQKQHWGPLVKERMSVNGLNACTGEMINMSKISLLPFTTGLKNLFNHDTNNKYL